MGFDHHIPEFHRKRPTSEPLDFLTVNTQPFADSHFAVFPEALVEWPIKATTPEWICKKCGLPRERITTTTYSTAGHSDRPKDAGPKGKANGDNNFGGMQFTGVAFHTTVAWGHCSCENPEYRPGVILDPFGGSGTVMKVARDHHRSSVYMDVKPEYVLMAKHRAQFGEITIDDSVEWVEVKV